MLLQNRLNYSLVNLRHSWPTAVTCSPNASTCVSTSNLRPFIGHLRNQNVELVSIHTVFLKHQFYIEYSNKVTSNPIARKSSHSRVRYIHSLARRIYSFFHRLLKNAIFERHITVFGFYSNTFLLRKRRLSSIRRGRSATVTGSTTPLAASLRALLDKVVHFTFVVVFEINFIYMYSLFSKTATTTTTTMISKPKHQQNQ